MRKLIIGLNSRIVKSLDTIDNFDIISHANLINIDFDVYSDVYVFSWSYTNNADNILIISKIPPSKLIFVSTISVLSIQKRNQWANYVNDKIAVEKIVTLLGGRILRIASVDRNLILKLSRPYAYTSVASLRTFLESYQWPKQLRIFHLFQISSADQSQTGFLITFLINLSSLIPNYKILQLPIIFVHKLFKSISYGYTYECHEFINEELQIGYGALGSAFDLSHRNPKRKIIASYLKNQVLNDNGFNNFYIGKDRIGLSRYWHGVKTTFVDASSSVLKHVLFKVPRPSMPRFRSVVAEVLSVSYQDKIWVVTSVDSNGMLNYDFAKKLILAAGPFENTRLISQSLNISTTFDDDENAFIGQCELTDAIHLGMVKKVGPFIKNIKGLLLRKDFFVEIRPRLDFLKYPDRKDNVFYSDSTFRILLKLISKMSFSRINEAFYNKFGISFSTSKVAIFVQALSNGSIYLKCDQSRISSIGRVRLSFDHWKSIQNLVSLHFLSFEPTSYVQSFDGLHVKGGLNPDIFKLISGFSESNLVILGSPSQGRDDPLHTTRLLQDLVRN